MPSIWLRSMNSCQNSNSERGTASVLRLHSTQVKRPVFIIRVSQKMNSDCLPLCRTLKPLGSNGHQNGGDAVAPFVYRMNPRESYRCTSAPCMLCQQRRG